MKQANKKNKKRKSQRGKISHLQIITLITIILIVTVLVIKPNFSNQTKTQNNRPTEIQFKKEGELSFNKKENNQPIKTIDIEIAEGEADTALGLMYRYSMSENMGMLFIMDTEELCTFWMKETYISLDIIFLNNNLEIVNIHKYAQPLSEQSVPSVKKAKYVVEVVGGFCDKFGIKKGDRINFDRTLNKTR